MIEAVPGIEQKIAAYARHHKAMTNPATPTKEFDNALWAMDKIDKDTKGRVRTIFVSRLNIQGSLKT